MKLSEAIRLGSLLKSQGFAGLSGFGDAITTCALGAAKEAVGNARATCRDLWPWTSTLVNCPWCNGRATAYRIIALHLNDHHRWTREQIADWVETVEPKEAVVLEMPQEVGVK